MRGLKDKVAIVAGAAPGNIGGATAIRLAEEGMKVVAADLNEAAAQAVADQIRDEGGTRASWISPRAPTNLKRRRPLPSAVIGVHPQRVGLLLEGVEGTVERKHVTAQVHAPRA